jgi:hypothetical protein
MQCQGNDRRHSRPRKLLPPQVRNLKLRERFAVQIICEDLAVLCAQQRVIESGVTV